MTTRQTSGLVWAPRYIYLDNSLVSIIANSLFVHIISILSSQQLIFGGCVKEVGFLDGKRQNSTPSFLLFLFSLFLGGGGRGGRRLGGGERREESLEKKIGKTSRPCVQWHVSLNIKRTSHIVCVIRRRPTHRPKRRNAIKANQIKLDSLVVVIHLHLLPLIHLFTTS